MTKENIKKLVEEKYPKFVLEDDGSQYLLDLEKSFMDFNGTMKPLSCKQGIIDREVLLIVSIFLIENDLVLCEEVGHGLLVIKVV